MTILGIDPGLVIIGYGVVKQRKGGADFVACGAITTAKDAQVSDRLCEIYRDLNMLLTRFSPDAVAVEQLFFHQNQKTIIPVAEARGVILLALAQANIPIYEYTPLQMKMTLTGYGRATKQQIMEMTRLRLGLSALPKPDDAADALAIALCHSSAAESRLLTQKGNV
jgi:crossover junction endodeoxyribonuclease RuvC